MLSKRMKIHWKALDIVNPSRIRKLSGRKYAHHYGLLDGFTHCYRKNGVMGFVESFREVFVIWVSWFVVWEYVEHVSCQTCC